MNTTTDLITAEILKAFSLQETIAEDDLFMLLRHIPETTIKTHLSALEAKQIIVVAFTGARGRYLHFQSDI